jgi:uncharacterized surface protein with fasciclin (FAS1) repeats
MRRRLLIPAGALILMLAACGDDDGDTTAPTATEVEQTAGDAAEEGRDAASDAATEIEGAAGDAADELEEVDPTEVGEAASEVVAELRARGLNTVATAIEAIGAENVLRDRTFTLFAPSDEAFLSLDADELSDLLADPQQAAAILQDHVLDERVLSTELGGMDQVTTAAGTTVPVTSTGDQIAVGGATVTEADIEVGDGVIHVIDAVVGLGPTGAGS